MYRQDYIAKYENINYNFSFSTRIFAIFRSKYKLIILPLTNAIGQIHDSVNS